MKYRGILALVLALLTSIVHAKKITEVIIPSAGMGTRFMPMTKSVSKEFVHIKDGKPAIEYVVREAASAGLTDVILVVNEKKIALVDYFRIDCDLNAFLASQNKLHYLEELNKLCLAITVRGVIQEQPLGTGHAVMCAQEYIMGDYFGVLYPDNPMISDVPAMKQLVEVAMLFDASVIAVQALPLEQVTAYAAIAYTQKYAENVYLIDDIIEKPTIEDVPSNLACIGRYVLSKDVFQSLQNIPLSVTGEYWLTDAIADLIARGKTVLACRVDGQLFDTGNPKNWFEAVQTMHAHG